MKYDVGESLLDKRINLYKSTLGQIDKMIEETHDEEALSYLKEARDNVSKGFVTENRAMFKRLFNALGDAFQIIGETLRGIFE